MTQSAEPAPGSPPPGVYESGSMSALRFMITAGTLTVLALVTLGGLVFLFRPTTAGPDREIIQEVTMPDGTILSLESVTFGTSHAIDLGGGGFFGGMRHIDNEGTSGEKVGIWLTRRDPRTGQPLDFDWWSHCAVTDANGCEIRDSEHVSRQSWQNYGSSGEGRQRPMPPLSPQPYTQIVVFSHLPKFRAVDGRFQLRVYDTKGTKVAEFDAPYPDPATYPTWEPEPLPITKRDGDLSLTLKGLKTTAEAAWDSGDVDGKRWQIQSDFAIAWEDRPTDLWTSVRSERYSDVLGNTGDPWNCELCPREPAWKLTATVFPNPDKPEAADVWMATALPAPTAAGVAQFVSQTGTVHGLPIDVTAVGGSGMVVYTESVAPGAGGGLSSSGGEFNYLVEARSENGLRTTRVTCTQPHVRFRLDGLIDWTTTSIKVSAVDDQGRDVKVEVSGMSSREQSFAFLKLPGDTKSFDMQFVVQQGKTFEFLVAPPKEILEAEEAEADNSP